MEKEFKDRMEQKLLREKEEIIHSLVSENEEFNELVGDIDPKDFADVAADDIDKKTLEAINEQELRRLRLIDSALSRLHNGRYGLCMSCGSKISAERLEAIPYALMCIACKSTDERRNR